MLREDIREFVSFLGCKTVNNIIKKVDEWEIELELQINRKSKQVQIAAGQSERPNTSN